MQTTAYQKTPTDQGDTLAATKLAKTAPGQLEIVRRLLNTARPSAADRLDDAEKLKGWLLRFGLVSEDVAITKRDVERMKLFRSALQSFVRKSASEEEIQVLNSAAELARPRVDFGKDGSISLRGSSDSFENALSMILAIISEASWRGEWTRLRICANPECWQSFYDRSKNNKRTWCSMLTCGNKHNARLYRTRKQQDVV